MKTRDLVLTLIILILATLFPACAQGDPKMRDGYYSAEAANFDANGWKEYISIYVRDNKIVTVEYNARNSSGFIQSWDVDYMRAMFAQSGAYPSEYTRNYAVSLLNWQNPDNVDPITGASFQLLAKAAIEQAKAGDKQVALVEIPEEAEHK